MAMKRRNHRAHFHDTMLKNTVIQETVFHKVSVITQTFDSFNFVLFMTLRSCFKSTLPFGQNKLNLALCCSRPR